MEELTRKLQSSEITLAEFLREQQLVLSRGDYLSDDAAAAALDDHLGTSDEDYLLEGGGGTPHGDEDNVAAAAAAQAAQERLVGGHAESKTPDEEDDEPRPLFGPTAPPAAVPKKQKQLPFGPAPPPRGGHFAGLVDYSDDDDDDVSEDEDEESEASGAEAERHRTKKKAKKPDKPPDLSTDAIAFINQNRAAPAACAGKRKSAVFKKRNSRGAGAGAGSKKKNGGRSTDVSTALIKKRIEEHPDEGLCVLCAQLHCRLCHRNIGSASTATNQHIKSQMHKNAKEKAAARGADGNVGEIKSAMDKFKSDLPEGHSASGMDRVPEAVRVFRAELVEVCGKAGIPMNKISKMREFLEQRVGMPLARPDNLVKTYLPVLTAKEKDKLRSELKGQLVGVYHDGTTWLGEAFAIVVRWCTEDFTIPVRCVGVSWRAGSLDNTGISAELINTLSLLMGIPVENVLAWMHDCVSANLTSYNSTLAPTYHNSDDNGCLPHTLMHVGEKFAFVVLAESCSPRTSSRRRSPTWPRCSTRRSPARRRA